MKTLQDFKQMLEDTESTISTVIYNVVVINSMADGDTHEICLDFYDEETYHYCLSYL